MKTNSLLGLLLFIRGFENDELVIISKKNNKLMVTSLARITYSIIVIPST